MFPDLFFQLSESAREFIQMAHRCIRCVAAGVTFLRPLLSIYIVVPHLVTFLQEVRIEPRESVAHQRRVVNEGGEPGFDTHQRY